MKVAVSQMKSKAAFLEENANKIVQASQRAAQAKADLLVFPELSVNGYMAMDLFLNDDFVQAGKRKLEEIAKRINPNISALVGFVDMDKEKRGPENLLLRYNSVALLQEGKVSDVFDKTLLPQYDVFSEKRYFHPSRKKLNLAQIAGQRCGIQVCEDMWGHLYGQNLGKELRDAGADILINLSASPWTKGKLETRKKILEEMSRSNGIPAIYTNLVGSFDGYDGQLVFDGRSLAYDKEGNLIARGKKFEEDFFLVDTNAKGRMPTLEDSLIDDIYDALVFGIQEYVGQEHVYVGSSGGIDSALTLALAVDALGADKVHSVAMPSDISSPDSLEDAANLAKQLHIQHQVIPIGPMYTAYVQTLEQAFEGKEKNVTEENLQARIRGDILMALSNKHGGYVLTTGNRTETGLGYCTLYGDMAGALSVLGDVDKQEVYALSELKNQRARKEIIPKNILGKAPSAGLALGQSDEESLGAPYSTLAPLTNAFIEGRESRTNLETQYGPIVPDLLSRFHANEFKRRQAAPAIKVQEKSFGHGRRIPIYHGWK